MSDETREIAVGNFRDAKERVKQAELELTAAQGELVSATNELGKALVPGNAPIGSVYHLWVGENLVRAERLDGETFKVYEEQVP